MGFLSKIFKKKSSDRQKASEKKMLGGKPLAPPNPNERVDVPAHKPEGYVFLDLETPNRRNDSICSIALVETDASGNVLREAHDLIDPKAEFDHVNIAIHGITPAHVNGAPDIWAEWPTLKDVIADNVIIAHNAPFDMGVLNKALASCELPPFENEVLDTMKFARIADPDAESVKLDALCARHSIPLANHHDALCDARACKNLFWRLVELHGSIPTANELENTRTTPLPRKAKNKTKRLADLKDVMERAIADGVVSLEEAQEVASIIEGSEDLAKDASLKPIKKLLDEVLEDGKVDEDESKWLVDAFTRHVNPLINDRPPVEFEGSLFVVTGDFEHGPRPEIEAYIVERGGEVHGSVIQRCDYVIIGNLGSELWSFGNYGNKVKKALELQNKGKEVKILSEDTLFDS